MKVTKTQLETARDAATNVFWGPAGTLTRVIEAAIASLPEPGPSEEMESLKEALRATVAERDNLLKQQEALLAQHRQDLERMARKVSDEEWDAWTCNVSARVWASQLMQARLREILPKPSEALVIARSVNASSNYVLDEDEVQAVLDAKARLDGAK